VLTRERFHVQVLTREFQAQFSGEGACAVPEASWVVRLARIRGLVHHRAGEFRIVGPRAEVDVVGADRGPYVVDHADLRVDVHRCAGVVLERVHGDSPAAGTAQSVQGRDPADQVHRQGESAVLFGDGRDDGDEAQAVMGGECLGEGLHHMR